LKHFSGIEQQIIKVLKRRRQSTFSELAELIYKDGVKPIHATTVISGAVKRINLKFVKAKSQMIIEVLGDAGPKGKIVKLT
jgi:hypothetical protein